MSEQTTQRQQILDLNKVIDRQAAQLGKLQKRIDAAGAVITAAQHLMDRFYDEALYNALAAAKEAGFETGSEHLA